MASCSNALRMEWRSLLTCLLAVGSLCGCSGRQDGELSVAFMESERDLFQSGLRLSPGAQNLRAATGSGLVAMDAQGEIIAALADRWIVTDDGRSYIFRLRDGQWPDGKDLTGESVKRQLQSRIQALRGTSLGLDLLPISEVRAMAGRVVEIRLAAPVPYLLQVLAQPEMTLGSGANARNGPMSMKRDGASAILSMRPPAALGLPDDERWQQFVRPVRISAMSAADAVKAFDEGNVTVVLGGRFDSMPLADTGPLSRGTFRLDAPSGLFGLLVRRESGVLATPQGREALLVAICRGIARRCGPRR
jgi:oligopeptide transport system substrate-binding protein